MKKLVLMLLTSLGILGVLLSAPTFSKADAVDIIPEIMFPGGLLFLPQTQIFFSDKAMSNFEFRPNVVAVYGTGGNAEFTFNTDGFNFFSFRYDLSQGKNYSILSLGLGTGDAKKTFVWGGNACASFHSCIPMGKKFKLEFNFNSYLPYTLFLSEQSKKNLLKYDVEDELTHETTTKHGKPNIFLEAILAAIVRHKEGRSIFVEAYPMFNINDFDFLKNYDEQVDFTFRLVPGFSGKIGEMGFSNGLRIDFEKDKSTKDKNDNEVLKVGLSYKVVFSWAFDTKG